MRSHHELVRGQQMPGCGAGRWARHQYVDGEGVLAPQPACLASGTSPTSQVSAQIIAFGILILSGVWYLIVKNRQKARGINVDFAFKEIPPE
jgi:hypothetical protein